MTPRTLALTSLLGWCAALLGVRMLRSESLSYVFLAWNLFLAAIPAFAAWMLGRVRTSLGRAGWAAVWLAFLPNAPYITTDILHLRARPHVPLWYDIALLVSASVTGLVLCYVSVADVERFVEQRFGRTLARVTVAGALLLSGLGVYIGRVLRWNSWDLATDPFALLTDIVAGPHRWMVSMTAVYGCGLLIGYVTFRALLAERATRPL